MHAWEMGNAYFDYFFFKENCSYHILSLLEYANPDLHLREQFHFWTIPADTVRIIVAQPGLVGATTYRPSRSTIIRRKRTFLTPEEWILSKQIVRSPEAVPGSHIFRAACSAPGIGPQMSPQTICVIRPRVTIRR